MTDAAPISGSGFATGNLEDDARTIARRSNPRARTGERRSPAHVIATKGRFLARVWGIGGRRQSF